MIILKPTHSKQSISKYYTLSPIKLHQKLKIFTPNLSKFKNPLTINNNKKSNKQIKQ